jgi:hypothetical protein
VQTWNLQHTSENRLSGGLRPSSEVSNATVTSHIGLLPPYKSKCRVKAKSSLCLTKHHAIKMYERSGGIAPRLFNLCTRRRWVVSFMSRTLYSQEKSPWYPLNRRLGGPQSRCGRGGEKKKKSYHCPRRELNPGRPAPFYINEMSTWFCTTN